MKTLHLVCGVIPPHILSHVAEHPDDAGRADALSTLEQMRELATARARMTLRPRVRSLRSRRRRSAATSTTHTTRRSCPASS